MEDFADRYGVHFVKLIDHRASKKEFEFDQVLLTPTAKGYRELVEQAKIEIDPEIINYLSNKWSEGALENFLFFAMAVVVYARSIYNPPFIIDLGKLLLRTVAFCNKRCVHRSETGGGCRLAMNESQHHLPKCIKVPRDIEIIWGCLKRYIATGIAISVQDAKRMHGPLSVQVSPDSDFMPATSC
jgi:hypothetical protein